MTLSNNLENKIPCNIFKRSSYMSESSSSLFLRTTAGIQSGTDAFEEINWLWSYLQMLRVKGILCSFRLVLEKKMRT